jgi:hypothetical protein
MSQKTKELTLPRSLGRHGKVTEMQATTTTTPK